MCTILNHPRLILRSVFISDLVVAKTWKATTSKMAGGTQSFFGSPAGHQLFPQWHLHTAYVHLQVYNLHTYVPMWINRINILYHFIMYTHLSTHMNYNYTPFLKIIFLSRTLVVFSTATKCAHLARRASWMLVSNSSGPLDTRLISGSCRSWQKRFRGIVQWNLYHWKYLLNLNH